MAMDTGWGVHNQKCIYTIFNSHDKLKGKSSTQSGRQRRNLNVEYNICLDPSSHENFDTTNNFEKTRWPHGPIYRLTFGTGDAQTFTYTQAVWSRLASWYQLQQLPRSTSTVSIFRWWKKCREQFLIKTTNPPSMSSLSTTG